MKSKQMGGLEWEAISRNSNPKTIRELEQQYKAMGYKTHITPNGKRHEILWINK